MNALSVLFVLVSGGLAAFTGGIYGNLYCWEGRPCTADAQCKQDNGQTAKCCGGVCRTSLVRGEMCNANAPSGCPSCDSALTCATDGSVLRCQAKQAPNGCLCNSTGTTGNAGCLSGNCELSGRCEASAVFVGGSCEENNQCQTKNCTSSTCQYLQDNDPCTPNTNFNLCGPGQVCLSGGRCGDYLASGITCKQDYECLPGLYCNGTSKKCVNLTATGQSCDPTSCMGTDVCNNGTCVAYRSVASGLACSLDDACISQVCAGAVCKNTHYLAAGAACTADDQCPYFASCTSSKACTSSSLGLPCNPTLSGGDMAAQCLGSQDVYCSCSGLCLPIATAILPVGGSGNDACQNAKDYISKFSGLKDLTRVDISTLTPEQVTAIATNVCCQDCGKGKRVSAEGFSVDCQTKTISKDQLSCSPLADDPLALTGCPKEKEATSLGLGLGPNLLVFVFCFLSFFAL